MTNLPIGQNTMEKIMESRAREFHKVLDLSDKESCKKFMKENYTKEFLEKPIKLNRLMSGSDGGNSLANRSQDNLDTKAEMYGQLHNDFGVRQYHH